MEFAILDALQKLHAPALTTVMKVITSLGDAGLVWILLALVLLMIPKTRKTGAVVAIALILDLLLCNVFLKNLIARLRPYEIRPMVEILIRKPSDYSFPSGHTAASFAAVSALFFTKDREEMLWGSALVLAVLIAFSRLYFYVHYPTDVLGGAAIGLLCGYWASKLAEMIESMKIKKCGSERD